MPIEVPASITSLKDLISLNLDLAQETIIDNLESPLNETFNVVILSGEPHGSSNLNAATAYGNPVDHTGSANNPAYFFARVRRLDVDSLEKPDPFKAGNFRKFRRLVNLHPLGAAVSSGDTTAPAQGDIWEARYLNKFRKGLILNKKVGRSQAYESLRLSDKSSDWLKEVMDANPEGKTNGDYNPPSQSFDREILSIEHKLPSLSSGGMIVGTGVPGLTAIAEAEHTWWEGKKETTNVGVDQPMKDKLLQYWTNVGFPQGGVDGCKGRACPWSAAYVSYLLRDASFTGAASHVKYTKYNKDGPSWKAFSIKKNKDKIKIQLGDILIKARYGKYTSWGSSHGDVIYKIENNKAYSSGGNVSGTAKMAQTFTLTSDGFLTNPGKYVVILKKMK